MKYEVDNKKVIFSVETGIDIKKITDFTNEELQALVLELIEENGNLEDKLTGVENELEEKKDEVENLEDFCQELRGLA